MFEDFAIKTKIVLSITRCLAFDNKTEIVDEKKAKHPNKAEIAGELHCIFCIF